MTVFNPLNLSLLLLALAIIISLLGRKFHLVKWWLVLLSIGVSTRYLFWRFNETLNYSSFTGVLLSVIIFAAELYGFFATLLFYFQVAGPQKAVRTHPKRTIEPTVDVLVTIFNEPVDILYRTLVGCKAMVYPEGKKTVYVLDDGPRQEVKAMAEKLGCRYLTRPTNEHAKAGSLNNALKFSHGELVLNFDSDHVPVSSFLEECVGFFEDEKVGFVQTPHHFYNPDPYQRNLRLEKQIIHEQDLFFQVIQPGRNTANSSFYCGSGAVFRRSALDAVGGFITKSVTEDIHTSILLHSKGYRSVYYLKRLAAGLSPESFGSYLRQRQRWARGHAQIFLSRENPLIIPGLSIPQRINYFASIYYFFLGIPRVIYLIGPLFYLLLGIPPIVADFSVLIHYFLSHYIVAVLAFQVVSGRYRNPFWSDVYETVMSFYLAGTALATLFLPKRLFFAVTPKGQQFPKPTLDVSFSLPQWTVGVLLLSGLVYGSYLYWMGEGNHGAFFISVFWTFYNLILISAAIITAREQAQRRNKPRLKREIPCHLVLSDGNIISTYTQDISETGLSLLMEGRAYLPLNLSVRLESAFGESTLLNGRVVRYEKTFDEKTNVGIVFLDLNESQHQSVIRHMYSDPDCWEKDFQISRIGFLRSFILLLTTWRALAKEKILRRSTLRQPVKRHCELFLKDETVSGITQDVSLTGASFKANHIPSSFPPEFLFKIYWDHESYVILKGEVAWQKPHAVKSSCLGIHFKDLEKEEVEILRNRLYSEKKNVAATKQEH